MSKRLTSVPSAKVIATFRPPLKGIDSLTAAPVLLTSTPMVLPATTVTSVRPTVVASAVPAAVYAQPPAVSTTTTPSSPPANCKPWPPLPINAVNSSPATRTLCRAPAEASVMTTLPVNWVKPCRSSVTAVPVKSWTSVPSVKFSTTSPSGVVTVLLTGRPVLFTRANSVPLTTRPGTPESAPSPSATKT